MKRTFYIFFLILTLGFSSLYFNARRDAALKLFTPQITAQTYAYYNFGRSIDPQTNTYFNTTSFHNNYKISKTGMLITDSQEKQVEADLAEKENILRNTQISMEQQKALYEEKLIAREEYLKAEEDYKLARQKYELMTERSKQDSLYRGTQIDRMEESLENMQLNMSMIRKRKSNLIVKAPIDGELGLPDNIRAGQAYYLNLQLGQPEEAVIIPRGTFYQKTGGKWIYVVNKDGNKAVKREIRIGRQNPQYYEVLEGLEPGERVITSGYDTYGDSDVLVF